MTTPLRTVACLAALLFIGVARAQDDPPSSTDDPVTEREGDASPEPLDPDTTLRLEPVTVTARRWTELVQEVPQSVTVIGADTIRDAGITSIAEAAQLVPNLHMTEFTSRRLSFPTFRGISTGVGDPSVTTYVDGVPQLQIGSTNITLLDVDRIEFLRGPQGTLFGRNSIGGVIQLETARPSNTLTVHGSTTWGNYDLREHALSFSGPLVEDRLFVTLSGLYSERDGYTKNDVTGNRVDDRRSTFGRGKLLFTPDDRNEFQFITYHERSRDGGFALGFLDRIRDRDHHIAVDFEGDADRDIASYALTWTHEADAFEVTSVSSYVDWDIDEQSDFDFSPIDGIRRTTEESQDYFYQEVRLASPDDAPLELDDRGTLKWLVGTTFFTSSSDRSAANESRPGGAGILFPPFAVGTDSDRGDFDDDGIAVFGQATLTIDDRLDLSAGLRYDYEDKEADITNAFETGGFPVFSTRTSRDDSYDEFSPTFSVALRPSDDVMLYARAARGFKAGGFNLRAPAGEESFDTETSWSYELGLKSTILGGRVTFNAAFFYIDWEDLQLSLFDVASGGYVDNAGDATSAGFELELAAAVTEGLDVFASYGRTDATFDEFTDQFGTDVAGNDLAFVPESTASVGAQLGGSFGNGVDWFARAEYQRVGTYPLDAGNLESEDYDLANFRLGIAWRNLRVEGWMRNAFDDDYVLVAFQPSPFDPTTFVGENGAPQTYGVSLSLRF
jgi:iron complex outermembrane receptor protein